MMDILGIGFLIELSMPLFIIFLYLIAKALGYKVDRSIFLLIRVFIPIFVITYFLSFWIIVKLIIGGEDSSNNLQIWLWLLVITNAILFHSVIILYFIQLNEKRSKKKITNTN